MTGAVQFRSRKKAQPATRRFEIRDSFPTALLTGFDGETVEACLRQLGPELHLLVAGSEAEALRLLGAQPVALLALGGAVAGESALRLLAEAESTPGAETRINLVLGAGPDPTLFQDLIDRDRVFYLSQEPVPAADLIALLRSGAERWRAAIQRGDGEERRRTLFARRLLAATQSISTQRKPEGVARAAAEAVEEVTEAERGYCLLYDRATETLWEPPRDADLEEERRESAAVGLVSFVLRTGRPLAVERIGADPRFDREADDPKARGDERFAAMPVLGPDGRVLAVLAAVRRAEERAFDDEDLKGFTLLAEQAAPTFAQLQVADGHGDGLAAAALFREEAVEHHNVGMRGEGDVLRVDPGWMRWTFRLLVTVLVAGLLFTLVAQVHDYAAGPAVVRLGGRSDLTATADGTVSQVAVATGEKVDAGRLLVRFYGAREAAELARLDHEFELQLINRLRDPTDAGAQSALLDAARLARAGAVQPRRARAAGAGGGGGERHPRAGGAAHLAGTVAAVDRPRPGAAGGDRLPARRGPAAAQARHAAAPGDPGLPLRLPGADHRFRGRRGGRPRRGSALPGRRDRRRGAVHRAGGEGRGASQLAHLRGGGEAAPLS